MNETGSIKTTLYEGIHLFLYLCVSVRYILSGGLSQADLLLMRCLSIVQ